jgi:hypothetical protein
MYLPADQGKDCDAKCQDTYEGTWNCHKVRQAKEKKEQDQTPRSDRVGHSHFHSPLRKLLRLREPAMNVNTSL